VSKKTTQTTSIDKPAAQKILRSVPYNQGFHFFTSVGRYTGETAIDLFAFYEELRVIENDSVIFHFPRGDFQKWIKETLGDNELADRIDKINPQQSQEKTKKELIETIESRLVELQTLANDP
jgi:hypothetical protein